LRPAQKPIERVDKQEPEFDDPIRAARVDRVGSVGFLVRARAEAMFVEAANRYRRQPRTTGR
jgi:hypothetical protein